MSASQGTAGQATVRFDYPQDEERFKERIGGEKAAVSIRLADTVDDTSGHAFNATTVHALIAGPGEDDTQGHAIQLHFPTAEQARDFRNRLLVTGALLTTVAVGGIAAPIVVDTLTDAASAAGTSGATVTDTTLAEEPDHRRATGTDARVE